VDCCGRTAYFFARSEGMAKMLMMRGVLVEKKDNYGIHAAGWASKDVREQIRKVDKIIEEPWYGCLWNACCWGWC